MRIPCYMFDCAARLRPAAFFDIAQELAAQGSERLNFADADLAPHGLVWILARMSVRYNSLPVRGDSVDATTWHRGMDGPLFIREYSLRAGDGSIAVASTSSWLLMDMRTRQIARPARLRGVIPFEPEREDSVFGGTAKRISVPQSGFEQVCVHKVVYSDLDYNGHVNNAKYVVWALDALPLEVLRSRSVREISINFNREARPGDEVRLMAASEGDTCHIEGIGPEGQNFVCEILLSGNYL